ncbi:hypothetical protein COV19_06160 [Candidatus Woesearchaeota archaeon CG10_big_fil_rev_8_21_14_0_10_44_13]|nr:MAG: hypothetical protein COV19_06160 [Candidatus Woesearchaeota archaeon CG10_big_fil_rev_8_21_14_0_10_44_13]
MKLKVLIGSPTFEGKEYCLERYATRVKELSYGDYDILLVDNSKTDAYSRKIMVLGIDVVRAGRKDRARETIADSRNILRQRFLDGKYDYLLSLEQDVIPPVNIIEVLLEDKKDIVGGLYFNFFKDNYGISQIKPLAYMSVSKEEFEVLKGVKFKGTAIQEKILSGKITGPEQIHSQLSMDHVREPKLMEVLFTGLGCMLISRKVLEKVRFSWADDSFDDAKFAEDARKEGFRVFVDTKVRCEHLVNMEKSWKGIEY